MTPPPPMPALLITARNAVQVTGLTWYRVREIARRHGVPVYRLSSRSHAVPAALFMAAVEQAAAPQPGAGGDVDVYDQILRDIGAIK